jgi:hypothetical protein
MPMLSAAPQNSAGTERATSPAHRSTDEIPAAATEEKDRAPAVPEPSVLILLALGLLGLGLWRIVARTRT